MIRAYKEMRPRLGARAWVDASAQVMGLRGFAERYVGYKDDYRAAEGAA